MITSATESVACDLCGSRESVLVRDAVGWLHGHGQRFRLVRCAACGLVYVSPRPASGAMGGYYPAGYYAFRTDRLARLGPTARRHRALAERMTRALGPGRALDVGCGSGSLMTELAARGWQAEGVDRDAGAVGYVHDSLGLQAFAGDFTEMALSDGPYDLVTMLETLEHMGSPLAALRRAHGLLRPGGLLAVSVPNLDSLEYRLLGDDWVALDPPLHLYHFTPATLRRALEQTGFQVASLRMTASTAGLTRSLWLRIRRRGGRSVPEGDSNGSAGRMLAHQALGAALWPLGWLLSALGMGPGLVAIAARGQDGSAMSRAQTELPMN